MGSSPGSSTPPGSDSDPDEDSDPGADRVRGSTAYQHQQGRFPCPACSVVAHSEKDLIAHANQHNSGLLQERLDLGVFLDLGLSGCSRCSRFYKTKGLTNHQRYCKVLVVDPIAPEHKGDDWTLPPLDEVFSTNRPTLTFVPAAHRQAWGSVLAKELYNVRLNNSLEAWTRLFMLPKCVLVAPKRGGKRNRGDNLTITELCDSWTAGELEWLWNRSRRPEPDSKPHSADPKRVAQTAILHARHGRLGKACAALSSSGLAPDSPATWEKLKAKHPVANPPEDVEPVATAPLQLSAEFNLLGTLASFSKEVGTDGTCFRVQHLLDATEAQLPTPLLFHLRAVVNLLLSGEAAVETRLYTAGARLTALAKGESDVRPIAAGNIFRRLASKCACALLQTRIRNTLGPKQLGVAQPGGAEKIIHSMRGVLASRWEGDDFTILKVDFANAFNSISRDALLNQVRKLFPDLLPWVRWCYGDQPLLFHQMGTVRSCVGVQQGDPLGPLLFCLVLLVLMTRIAELCPALDFDDWFLDDGHLAGPTLEVVRALAIMLLGGLYWRAILS